MSKQVRILFPDQIHQEKLTGGFLRTFNLAKLASKEFKTYIFGISENEEYEHNFDGIHLVQEKKHKNVLEKVKHYSEGLLSENYSLMKSKKAFLNFDDDKTVFHVEGPLVYNLLKQHNIKNYVLDEQNVYWEFSEFPNFDFKNRIYNKMTAERDKRLEMESLKNATHVLACSDRDKQIMVNEVPEVEGKITVIPNCVSTVNYDNYANLKNIGNKFKVLFVGLLSYQPNTDAVNIICNNIAPKCDENVEFFIAGNNHPVIKSKPKNVKFLGYVEDLKKCISEADICIAPLRYGSGTRLKILEYMVMGKPVVSTSKGAEGINYVNNKHIVIEDNIESFAAVIDDLLKDEKRRTQLGKEAKKLIKSKYDWQIYKKTLNKVYNEVLNAD
ncbi:glycosyltransferase family 4 protein [Methanobacterium paludis]|uniref:Glycosyl transferase group 1 n=1 Tax=Methanobacterium paludis (strain DSM 25820 / JCM 18151 / SWAN1) TaxID=868131 RepID=F6D713_METPW|nr:glycosyltransferase family 4 protein [Methanobacterium paludis]AEG18380.1 glycosyl transferase group 1 [Methanobacterium paludis]